jgi:ceramide glucosyltransferase
LLLRMAAGVWIGAGILGDRKAAAWCWLIPFRDLFGFAVWVAGVTGDTVDWRGQKLHLYRDGKISKSLNLDPNG